MKFKIRLAYYMAGLFLGGIGVYYFLNAKAESRGVSFCYLPNCRVLKELRSKPVQFSKNVEQALSEKQITQTDIKNILEDGNVDFSKSNVPFEKGKLYVVEGQTTEKQNIEISFVLYSEKVKVYSIKKTEK